MRDGFYFEEDTLEELPLDEVIEGVHRELDFMKSFPVYQAVLRAEAVGKCWSPRWCYKSTGRKHVRARFVVRQFANSLDANFYTPHSWSRGHKSPDGDGSDKGPHHRVWGHQRCVHEHAHA